MRRWWHLAVMAVLVVAAASVPFGFWRGAEHRAYDFRLALLARCGHAPAASRRVVVVGLEEERMTREKPLLFWYPEFGRFVTLMQRYGAAAVGIDFVPNQSLAARLGDPVHTVAGHPLAPPRLAVLEEVGREADLSLTDALRRAGGTMAVVQGVEDRFLPFYYAAMAGWPRVTPGLLRLATDRDFYVRRYEPAPVGGLSPFASALYAAVTGKNPPPAPFLVNYLRTPGIPRFALQDVLAGRCRPADFAGKAVILCYESGTIDAQSTPVARLPGGVVHATALETLFTGLAFRPAPPAACLLVTALLAGVSLLASWRLRPLPAGGVVALVSGGYAAGNLLLLAGGTLLPLFPTVLVPFFALAVTYPYRYVTEERHRKRLYRAFSCYIEPQLIDTLLSRDPAALLKGERKEICILFLDVRNFTRLSRRTPPEEVVGFLNTLFGRVTEIIQRHEGFVNKFIGDGMLAFFATDRDAVANAVRAAVEILAATREINDSGAVRRYLGEWKVEVGIGINYGEVVVGNVGSERKMDFTVIGDPVNVAARIEGVTKEVGKPLLLSRDAVLQTAGEFGFVSVGTLPVKGIDEPLPLYTLTTL